MASTIANNDYVIVENDIVISVFKGSDLPEYNAEMTNVINITSLSTKPQLNWTYNSSDNTFAAPAVPEAPVVPELTPLEKLKFEFTDNQIVDFEYMGNVFNFSAETYNYLAGYASFAGLTGNLPDNFYWLNKSNEKVPMTLEQFTGFCDIAANRVFDSFNEYVNKRNAL